MPGLELDTRVEEWLRRLDVNASRAVLRRFALGCAERCGAVDAETRDAIEAALTGGMQLLRQQREAQGNGAVGATLSGLKRRLPSAAAQLARFEALHPVALEAALGAARMEILWVLFGGQRPMTTASAAQWDWLTATVRN